MFISRQKAVLTAALCLVTGLLPSNAKADISFIIDETHLADTLHTHLYPSSPSLPSRSEIKLAAVCFVTDMSECEDNIFGNSSNPPDYDFNPRDRCFNEGFIYASCPDGYKLGGKKCPYGPYYSECISVCPSGYVTCEAPYYGVGEACGGKYASCTCTPCGAGYDYTTIPEGYIQDGEACLDCDGQTKYKVKINPCDGFQDCGSMGGETGAETCQSGDVIKYDNCKPCPNLGTLSKCPSPFTCTFEKCSNLYYKSGCKAGYDWNEKNKTCKAQCKNKGTLTSCPSPFTCTYEDCSKKYYKSGCQTGYEWNAISQTCTKCSSDYKYVCSGSSSTIGGEGDSCGGRYKYCACKNKYLWAETIGECSNRVCYILGCKNGNYFYADGTCSTSKLSKKLLGIVWAADVCLITQLNDAAQNVNHSTMENMIESLNSGNNTLQDVAIFSPQGDKFLLKFQWGGISYGYTIDRFGVNKYITSAGGSVMQSGYYWAYSSSSKTHECWLNTGSFGYKEEGEDENSLTCHFRPFGYVEIEW